MITSELDTIYLKDYGNGVSAATHVQHAGIRYEVKRKAASGSGQSWTMFVPFARHPVDGSALREAARSQRAIAEEWSR